MSAELPLKKWDLPRKDKRSFTFKINLGDRQSSPNRHTCSSATHHMENNSASFSIVFDCSLLSFEMGLNFYQTQLFIQLHPGRIV